MKNARFLGRLVPKDMNFSAEIKARIALGKDRLKKRRNYCAAHKISN